MGLSCLKRPSGEELGREEEEHGPRFQREDAIIRNKVAKHSGAGKLAQILIDLYDIIVF